MSEFVVPREYQREHYEKLDYILNDCNFYIDKSKPGAGKTYPPIYFAQKYNVPLYVICPVTVEDTWSRAKKKYKFDLIEIISYASIRSVKNRQPKHGLLDRFDNTTDGGIENVEFKATEKLENLIESGVFFVFDECHNLKNRTAQWKACKEIAQLAISSKKSKAFLLSGTLFDKPEHAKQFLEFIGIIKSHYMYRSLNNNLIFEGFGISELIDYGNRCDGEKTQYYLQKHKFKFLNTKNIEKFIENFTYDMFIEVFCKKFSSVIPEDNLKNRDLKDCTLTKTVTENANIPSDLSNVVSNYIYIPEDKKNGYYNTDPETEEKISKAIGKLAKSVAYVDGAITENRINFGSVTLCLKELEFLKTDIFIRVAREILEANYKNKVILFFNYNDSIKKANIDLQNYNPLILTGATRKRGELIHKFNNESNSRLLIGNIKVGGTGIELDDKIGNNPRHLFISPSYFMIDMHQATLRIFRENTKSKAFTRFVYTNILLGTTLLRESKILEALARKSKVLKSIQYESTDYKYPGDYEDEYEGVSTELSNVLNTLARKKYEDVEVIKTSKKKNKESKTTEEKEI
jgi:hypothetical protein